MFENRIVVFYKIWGKDELINENRNVICYFFYMILV